MIYSTKTCGAVLSTITVAMKVKAVKKMRQSLSSTMAANLQSARIAAASSSSLILSVTILSSLRIRLSSLWRGW